MAEFSKKWYGGWWFVTNCNYECIDEDTQLNWCCLNASFHWTLCMSDYKVYDCICSGRLKYD